MASDVHTEPYLSVVIPAYDEAQRISSTLSGIFAYLESQPWSSEVLVVVDGGHDGTADIARRAAGGRPDVAILANPTNHGKGFAVRQGVLQTRGQFVLFSDADLSTPMAQVEPLLQHLNNGYDVAIGSRALPASDIQAAQPYWRQSMGRIFNWFVQWVVLPGIHDSQCGFKCFRGDVARLIFHRQRIQGFAFDVEVLWLARKLGYRVAEVPVTWINHPLSHVHPIYDAASMLVDLMRIRLNGWRGVYGK